MHSYQLQAVRDGAVKKRGTGWFVRERIVVTAWHVVSGQKTWLKDEVPRIEYSLVTGESSETLGLLSYDAHADVALLSSEWSPEGPFPSLAHALPATDARWKSIGFPAFEGRTPLALNGRVSLAFLGDDSKALQLTIDQRTQVEWDGISGCPIEVENEVVGIITHASGEIDTLFGTPVAAIRRLLLRIELEEILARRYRRSPGLDRLCSRLPTHLRVAAGVPATDTIRSLVQQASDSGDLLALVRAIEVDSAEREASDLREQLQALEFLGRSIRCEPLARYLLAVEAASRRPAHFAIRLRQRNQEEVYVPLGLRSDDEVAGRSWSISHVLRAHASGGGQRGLLVTGPPGSGKSTLLQHLLASSWKNPESLGLSRPFLPLLVECRHFVGHEYGGIESRLRAAMLASPKVVADLPEKFLDDWARNNRAAWILLVDGYDEVPSEQLAMVSSLILQLLDAGFLVIVTSRSDPSVGDDLKRRLKRYRISPLTDNLRRELASQWFGEKGVQFLKELRSIAAESMIETPLLFALVASLSVDRVLPRSTAGLYRAYTEVALAEMLESDVAIPHGVRTRCLPDLLARVALANSKAPQRNSLDELAQDHATVVESYYPQRSILENRDLVRDLLVLAATRSSLLYKSGEKLFWTHSTLREFLASEALAKEPTPESESREAISRWKSPDWRQVCLFLLTVWSERDEATAGFVRDTLRAIASEGFDGMAFCVEALRAGAHLPADVVDELVEKLAGAVEKHAETDICVRLMRGCSGAMDEASWKSVELLAALREQGVGGRRISRVVKELIALTRQETDGRPKALTELAALGCGKELTAIARDQLLPERTRREAAYYLGLAGCLRDSERILGELLRTGLVTASEVLDDLKLMGADGALTRFASNRRHDVKDRTKAIAILVEQGQADTLGELVEDVIRDDGNTSFGELLYALARGDHHEVVRRLAIDVSMPARVRVEASTRNLLSDEFREGARETLVAIATEASTTTEAAAAAIEALRWARCGEDVRTVFRAAEVRPDVKRLAALVLHKTGDDGNDTEVAEFLLKDATARLEAGSEDTGDIVEVIERLGKVGKHQEALGYANRLVDGSVDRIVSLKTRAGVLWDLGQYEGVIDDLTKALGIEPNDRWSLSMRGASFRLLGDLERGAGDLDRALAIERTPFSCYHRGRCRLDAKEAIGDFTKALDLDANHLPALEHRARRYLELGFSAEARADITRLVEREPNSADAWQLAGDVSLLEEEWDRARSEFSKAIELDESCAEAWGGRGAAEIQCGATPEARTDIDEAIRRCPSSYHRYLRFLAGARGGVDEARENADVHAAVEAAARELEENPGDPDRLADAALVRLVAGRRDDAARDFELLLRQPLATAAAVRFFSRVRQYLNIHPRDGDARRLARQLLERSETSSGGGQEA